MTRLLATLWLDCQLQIRNRFYLLSGIFAGIMILLMRYFLSPEILAQAIPALFLVTIAGTTYLFAGGLILFERGEGTLQGLTVTPLRPWEYLLSKVISLSLLALVESLLITGLGYGWNLNLGSLCSGILVMGILYSLICFIVVFRYSSVIDFLMPSLILNLILQLPMLDYFQLWDTPLLMLLPTQGPLLLMKAAFVPLDPVDLVYAVGISAISIIITSLWSYRCFDRFVRMGEGGT